MDFDYFYFNTDNETNESQFKVSTGFTIIKHYEMVDNYANRKMTFNI